MGAFLNSVHVRSDDFGAITEVLTAICQTHRIRMVAHKPRESWISVFPEIAGSTVDVGQEVARSIQAPLVHIEVFDDDAFQSRLYQNGSLVDHLILGHAPDGKGLDGSRKQSAQAYSSFLEGADQIEVLEALLAEPKFTFESQRMERFTRLLRIPSALQTYEDLVGYGPKSGLRHFPKRESIAAKEKATLDDLHNRGLLLARIELQRGVTVPWIISPGERCLVIGRDQRLTKYFLDSQREEDTGIRFKGPVEGIWSSPSGTIVLVHAAGALHRLALDTPGLAWSLPIEKVTEASVIDGRCRIAVSVGESIHFVSAEGRIEQTIATGWARTLAIHPSGSHVLASVGLGTPNPTARIYSWHGGEIATSFQLVDRLQQSFREQCRANPELWARTFGFLENSRPPLTFVSEFLFCREGKVLICATPSGVELTEWSELLQTTPDSIPKPLAYFHPSPPKGERGASSNFWCSAVALDNDSQTVLMTGMESRIIHWKPANNAIGELPTVAFRKYTARMVLSPSLNLLACEYAEFPREMTDPVILLWNYNALTQEAKSPTVC